MGEMKLKDRTSIITGAGSGMGEAVAVAFAEEGSRVVVVDIDASKGIATVEKIKRNGGEASFIHCDVTVVQDVKTMVKQTVDRYGKIDVLYNNVGFHDPWDDQVADLPEESWDRNMNINLRSMFLVAKYTICEMLKNKGGVIINVSSTGGLIAMDATGYAVSKAGVISLSKCIAQQYGARGIRCNCLCPGPVDTPGGAEFEKWRAGRQHSGPRPVPVMGRKASPEELARAALFLASDDSSFAAGATFVIDGGMMLPKG